MGQSSYINSKSREKFLKKKSTFSDVNALAAQVIQGNISAISKALTLVESSNFEFHQIGLQLVNKITSQHKNTIRLGVTGVPGVGKSTFIEALGLHLLKQNHKIGILAIDPSSTKTKGSILGDKTRMEQLSQHPNVFIRPTPSSGTLGGAAKTTRESIAILEAAGYNIIFVETVGVGQSEVAVSSMVDYFLLLMLPGAGDELQGIKRGIMEVADGIVINKAEGEFEKKAMLAKKQLENALHLFPAPASGVTTKVLLSSALQQKGINKVWNHVSSFIEQTKKSGYFDAKRKQQALYWFNEALKLELEQTFLNLPQVKDSFKNYQDLVISEKASPFAAAQTLLKQVFKNK